MKDEIDAAWCVAFPKVDSLGITNVPSPYAAFGAGYRAAKAGYDKQIDDMSRIERHHIKQLGDQQAEIAKLRRTIENAEFAPPIDIPMAPKRKGDVWQ